MKISDEQILVLIGRFVCEYKKNEKNSFAYLERCIPIFKKWFSEISVPEVPENLDGWHDDSNTDKGLFYEEKI